MAPGGIPWRTKLDMSYKKPALFYWPVGLVGYNRRRWLCFALLYYEEAWAWIGRSVLMVWDVMQVVMLRHALDAAGRSRPMGRYLYGLEKSWPDGRKCASLDRTYVLHFLLGSPPCLRPFLHVLLFSAITVGFCSQSKPSLVGPRGHPMTGETAGPPELVSSMFRVQVLYSAFGFRPGRPGMQSYALRIFPRGWFGSVATSYLELGTHEHFVLARGKAVARSGRGVLGAKCY